MNVKFQRTKIASALVSCLVASPAYSQLQLEEIVVTAQKRAESVQDVPIAITALSADSLEKTDTHDLSGLAVQVPGLTFSPFSPGQNIVALRGASSNDDGAGTDSSVAVFVDDVYMGRVSNINADLFDLERVEVLRGPQGTLYGKNTIGGAINIVSTRPNSDELEGKLKASIGNFNSVDIGALITGPLSENLSGKIALSSRTRDGWANNRILNRDQKDDDSQGIRAQLLYTGESFEALLSADFNELNVDDIGRVPVARDYNNNDGGANPAVFRAGFESACGDITGGRCVAGAVDGFAEREAAGISAKMVWDIGDSELTSITAFRTSEANWNMDATGSPDLALNDDIFDTTDQYSQEFRLASNMGDRADYVVGLWLLKEETDRSECFDLTPGSDCTNVVRGLNDGSDYYRQINETENIAAFGQLNWSLSNDWKLTLGGRVSYEEKTIENIALAGNFVIINETFSNTVSEDWTSFTPKLTLSYFPKESSIVFVTLSQGFKSGGFPAAPFVEEDTAPLEQEEATNLELGFKSDISDTFRLNGSVYHVGYEGLQIQSFGVRPGLSCEAGGSNEGDPRCFGGFQTFNAGDAEVTGAELEFVWLANENLSLNGFVGLMDSEFGTTNIENSGCCRNQEGQDLIRAPKLKYGISANYSSELKSGSRIDFDVSYNFTDDQRGELETYAIQPEFDLVDARLTWTNQEENLSVSLWGKNLADEEYINHIYTIASSVTAVYGDPRMYGVSATYTF